MAAPQLGERASSIPALLC